MNSELIHNGFVFPLDIFAPMNFGKGLYLWRNYRGMTQEELAVKADVTNDTISRHERRPDDPEPPSEPSTTTKAKLAKALGIKPEDFYRSPLETTPELSIEEALSQLKSVYARGTYSKEELETEVLKFLLEIKRGEKD